MSVSNIPPPVPFIAVHFLGVLNISRILSLSLTPAAHNNDLLGLRHLVFFSLEDGLSSQTAKRLLPGT